MRDEVTLAAFDPATHLAMVNRWLPKPHVFRWWRELSLEEKHLDFTPAGGHAIIMQGEIPAGYLRWDILIERDRALAGLGADDLPVMDIDIFIGEEAFLGRGIGPRALDILCANLARKHPGVQPGLCTSQSNHQAIGAFGKAGFREWRMFEDPAHGSCILMTRGG